MPAVPPALPDARYRPLHQMYHGKAGNQSALHLRAEGRRFRRDPQIYPHPQEHNHSVAVCLEPPVCGMEPGHSLKGTAAGQGHHETRFPQKVKYHLQTD